MSSMSAQQEPEPCSASMAFPPTFSMATLADPEHTLEPELPEGYYFLGIKDVSALFLLERGHPHRMRLQYLLQTVWFNVIILTCLCLGSVTVALELEFQTRGIEYPQMAFFVWELVWTTIFVIEFLINILADGFFMHPGSYLRHPFHWVDFLVVATSPFVLLDETSQARFNSLRFVRILRPLRTLKYMKGVGILMDSLTVALPVMRDALLFVLFSMTLCALRGMEVWAGVIHQRCYLHTDQPPEKWVLVHPDSFCDIGSQGPFQCKIGKCAINTDIMAEPKYANFDNWAYSMVLLLQIVSKDSWSESMFNYQRVDGFEVCVYFVLTSFVLITLVINLALAVLPATLINSRRMQKSIRQAGHEDHTMISETIKNHFDAKGLEELPTRSADLWKLPEGRVTILGMPLDDSPDVSDNECENDAAAEPETPDSYALQLNHAPKPPSSPPPAETSWMGWMTSYFWGSEESTSSHVDHVLHQRVQTIGEAALTLDLAKPEASTPPPLEQKFSFTSNASATGNRPFDRESSFNSSSASTYVNRVLLKTASNLRTMSPPPVVTMAPPLVVTIGDFASQLGWNGLMPIPKEPNPDPLDLEGEGNANGSPLHMDLETPKYASSSNGTPVIHISHASPTQFKALDPGDPERQSRLMPIPDARTEAERPRKRFVIEEEKKKLTPKAVVVLVWFLTRTYLKKMVLHPYFNMCMLVLACMNITLLSLSYYQNPGWLEEFLDKTNKVCTCVFLGEVVLKWIGLGVLDYFKDRWNIMDFFVVVGSLPELFVPETTSLLAFRVFRVFGIVRIIHRWSALQKLVKLFYKCSLASLQLTLVLCLITLILAMISQSFFGSYEPAGRLKFDSIAISILSTFVILSGELWYPTMVDISNTVGEWYPALYIIAVFFFGRFIIANFFMAIVIDVFTRETDLDSGSQKEEEMAGLFRTQLLARAHLRQIRPNWKVNDHGEPSEDEHELPADWIDSLKTHKNKTLQDMNFKPTGLQKLCWFLSNGWQDPRNLEGRGKSMGCIPPSNRFRRICARIVYSPLFEMAVVMVVLLDMMILSLAKPKGKNEGWSKVVLMYDDVIFTCIYSAEMLMRVLVQGFLRHPCSVLRCPGGITDMLALTMAIIGLVGHYLGLISIVFISPLRSLRSIRVVVRSEGASLILTSIAEMLPSVIRIIIMAAFLFFTWGILGVQLNQGLLYSCNDPDILYKADCVGVFTTNSTDPYSGNITRTMHPRHWSRTRFGFDNLAVSVLTLWEVASHSGWTTIMFSTMDSTSDTAGFQTDIRFGRCVYFVIFYCIGNYLVMNMFVGFLVTRYIQLKEALGGSIYLTESQRQWIATENLLKYGGCAPKVLDPKGRWWICRVCHKLALHPWFNRVTNAVIWVSVIILCVQHWPQTQAWDSLEYWSNRISASFFLIETTIRIVGIGWDAYIHQPQQKLEFFVVMITALVFIETVPYFEGLQALRVLKLLRLTGVAPSLRKFSHALIATLPDFVNMGVLVGIWFYIFSVTSVQLFGNVVRNGALNEYVNFERFANAMLTLYILFTGQQWDPILTACTTSKGCDPAQANCGFWAAALFFNIFRVVVQTVIMNLFISAIVDVFADKEHRGGVLLSDVECFESLKVAWLTHCKGTGKSAYWPRAVAIISMLPYPFGISMDARKRYRDLRDLSIPITKRGRVTYRSVMRALTRRYFEIDVPTANVIRNFIPAADVGPFYVNMFCIHHIKAATHIQSFWRAYRKRRNPRIYGIGPSPRGSSEHPRTAPNGSQIAIPPPHITNPPDHSTSHFGTQKPMQSKSDKGKGPEFQGVVPELGESIELQSTSSRSSAQKVDPNEFKDRQAPTIYSLAGCSAFAATQKARMRPPELGLFGRPPPLEPAVDAELYTSTSTLGSTPSSKTWKYTVTKATQGTIETRETHQVEVACVP